MPSHGYRTVGQQEIGLRVSEPLSHRLYDLPIGMYHMREEVCLPCFQQVGQSPAVVQTLLSRCPAAVRGTGQSKYSRMVCSCDMGTLPVPQAGAGKVPPS